MAELDALLQARIRLTLDALPWPVGVLRLEIGHASGGCLRLQLVGQFTASVGDLHVLFCDRIELAHRGRDHIDALRSASF